MFSAHLKSLGDISDIVNHSQLDKGTALALSASRDLSARMRRIVASSKSLPSHFNIFDSSIFLNMNIRQLTSVPLAAYRIFARLGVREGEYWVRTALCAKVEAQAPFDDAIAGLEMRCHAGSGQPWSLTQRILGRCSYSRPGSAIPSRF